MQRRRAVRQDGTPWVFHRKHGDQVKQFDKAWKTACRKAGIGKKVFHDLRRTATRNMRRAGVQETTIMKVTGHKTRIMFDRYNIIDEDDQRSALSRTQAHLKKTSHIIPLVTNK